MRTIERKKKKKRARDEGQTPMTERRTDQGPRTRLAHSPLPIPPIIVHNQRPPLNL